uniref:PH domain-containing protein n=1 Tax=Hucho hucho TaxID=62062 RepID=A0A4W5KQ55_9TELE
MVLGRCSSPLGQETTLKAGWLKRQRSIMRNWQLRWFVLHTEALYFYKDQDETKPQGCIILQGSQVSELSANQDEAGRHLFEIAPGKKPWRHLNPPSGDALPGSNQIKLYSSHAS